MRVAARPGRVAVGLQYPGAVRDVDLTHRPQFARGGVVRFRVGNRTVRVRRKRGRFFSVKVPAGTPVTVPARGARDRFRNVKAARPRYSVSDAEMKRASVRERLPRSAQTAPTPRSDRAGSRGRPRAR